MIVLYRIILWRLNEIVDVKCLPQCLYKEFLITVKPKRKLKYFQNKHFQKKIAKGLLKCYSFY